MSLLSEMLADSPGGCWMLASTADEANANTLTLVAAPSVVGSIIASVATGAYDLNGSSQTLYAADHATLDLANVWTLEAWIQLDALPGAEAIVINKGFSSYQMAVKSDGTMQLARTGASELCATTTTLTADGSTVHHIVGTKNGATIKQYIDGVDRTGSVTDATTNDTADALYIGSDAGTGSWLNGRVQAAAVYPTALSAARVLIHYNAGLASVRNMMTMGVG